jgi:hypothetical protein
VNLGGEATHICQWQGKALAATASELVFADPVSSTVPARSAIQGIRKLSTVNRENFAAVLAGNSLITVRLPSLVPADTFNATCTRNTPRNTSPNTSSSLFPEPVSRPGTILCSR